MGGGSSSLRPPPPLGASQRSPWESTDGFEAQDMVPEGRRPTEQVGASRRGLVLVFQEALEIRSLCRGPVADDMLMFSL